MTIGGKILGLTWPITPFLPFWQGYQHRILFTLVCDLDWAQTLFSFFFLLLLLFLPPDAATMSGFPGQESAWHGSSLRPHIASHSASVLPSPNARGTPAWPRLLIQSVSPGHRYGF